MRAATKYQRTPAQIMFQFMYHIGAIPLSGTKSEQHMREDVAVFAALPSGALPVTFTDTEIVEMNAFFLQFRG